MAGGGVAIALLQMKDPCKCGVSNFHFQLGFGFVVTESRGDRVGEWLGEEGVGG